jgi:hypothetical protein
MKTYKLFVAALLFIVCAHAGAQIHNVSSTHFTYIDLVNYSKWCRYDITQRIENGYANGKLKFYSEPTLSTPISNAEYNKLIEIRDDRQMPNPDNPDDIYDLIDTVIIYPARVRELFLTDKNTIEVIYDNNASMYCSAKQLKKLLDKRLLSMLDYFSQNGLQKIEDGAVVGFYKKQVSQLGAMLYNWGMSGEVKPYRNDSLNSTFIAEEIKDRVTQRINKQAPNPDNPDDIYDLIDSVISIPFVSDSINKIRLMFKWETEGFETEAEFFAIAPSFNPIIAGLEFPPTPIFIIKGNDYLKRINKQEKEFYTYFYSYMLQNRSANSEYDYFDETNPPTE